MKVIFRWSFLLPLLLACFAPQKSLGQNDATSPAPRDGNWIERHQSFVQVAKKGSVDLLFIGDSIMDGWRLSGSNVWNKYYAMRHAANFSISGDRTQNVLWRIENGELNGIEPKVIVLMIGTNNTGKERGGSPRNTNNQI